MSAGVHHIKVEKGATLSRTFTWKIDSNLVNLTGYNARMKVRDSSRRIPGNNEIVSLTSLAGGGITLGGAAGTVIITLSATATGRTAAGKYTYDLELESGSGEVTRLLKGSFTVYDEVTY
jgi:hypothetical protein